MVQYNANPSKISNVDLQTPKPEYETDSDTDSDGDTEASPNPAPPVYTRTGWQVKAIARYGY